MFNAKINDKIYNLENYSPIQWNENTSSLEFYLPAQGMQVPKRESGPEAAAFWEWYQRTVMWKMPVPELHGWVNVTPNKEQSE